MRAEFHSRAGFTLIELTLAAALAALLAAAAARAKARSAASTAPGAPRGSLSAVLPDRDK